MARLIWPIALLMLACACTVVSHNEEELTSEKKKELKRELDYLDGQIASKGMKIMSTKEKTSETRKALEIVRGERENLSEEIDAKIEKAKELMAQVQELARKLGPPTAQDEAAAEKLLLEAKYFREQNPTEAKPIISSKYKLVFERYPNTKAAKEARKIFDQLGK